MGCFNRKTNYYYLVYKIKDTKEFWFINEGYDLYTYIDHIILNNSTNELYYIYGIKIPKNRNMIIHRSFDKILITKKYTLLFCNLKLQKNI